MNRRFFLSRMCGGVAAILAVVLGKAAPAAPAAATRACAPRKDDAEAAFYRKYPGLKVREWRFRCKGVFEPPIETVQYDWRFEFEGKP